MAFESFLALRYIFHRKGRGFISLISFISVAGIAVGVMALIVVLSVMSGFDRELKDKIIGAQPHLLIVRTGGIEEPAAIIKQVRKLNLPGIVSIAPYVEGQGIVRSEANATGAIIKGLTSSDESFAGIEAYVKKGDLMALFETRTIVSDIEGVPDEEISGIALGYQTAQTLGVSLGDVVYIISPHLEEKKSSFMPQRARTEKYFVGAIFEFGMNSMDSSLVLIDIGHAQSLFALDEKSSGIAIRLEDEFQADVLKRTIQRNIGYPYWTESWIDVNRSFFSALKVEKTVMAVLLFLIILVAGFNIISTLIMVVMEKTKDIGILKALGATKASIMKIFLLQGSLVGFFGVLSGTALGLLITKHLNDISHFLDTHFGIEVFPKDIYYFSEIPTQLNIDDVVIIVVSALMVSLIGGIYPAFNAASLKPVDALRYE